MHDETFFEMTRDMKLHDNNTRWACLGAVLFIIASWGIVIAFGYTLVWLLRGIA